MRARRPGIAPPASPRARSGGGARAPRLQIADRFRPRSDAAFLGRVVQAALAHVGRRDLEVSLLLAGDAEIARLHAQFLGVAEPTDVLAFALDGQAEIAVSVECARREAARRKHTIRAELALYVVHGLLHVCGYDDRTARERRRMRTAERAVLELLGQRVTPFV
jgi:probable rRNA maturation factor